MTFLWPLALLGLLLVPALLAGYVLLQRRRQRYAVRFTNLDLLSNLVSESPRWRRHVPTALLLVALAALVVAVARPQASLKTPENEASVMLAVDVSGTMQATDVSPTRLAAARKAADTFLDRVPKGMRVGLVAFSNDANLLVAPTTDHAQVKAGLASLRPGGGTAIGDAVAVATQVRPERLASDATGSKPGLVVLLLSDGKPSPDTLDPATAAQRAREAGVPVYTVALGTDSGTVQVPDQAGGTQTVPVPPDRATLRQIAETTGGRFYDAPSESALTSVYERLGSSIGYTTEKRDVSFAFAAAGLVLVLAAGGLSALWFNRIP
jgi:Ca-activated chloride channel family protein